MADQPRLGREDASDHVRAHAQFLTFRCFVSRVHVCVCVCLRARGGFHCAEDVRVYLTSGARSSLFCFICNSQLNLI